MPGVRCQVPGARCQGTTRGPPKCSRVTHPPPHSPSPKRPSPSTRSWTLRAGGEPRNSPPGTQPTRDQTPIFQPPASPSDSRTPGRWFAVPPMEPMGPGAQTRGAPPPRGSRELPRPRAPPRPRGRGGARGGRGAEDPDSPAAAAVGRGGGGGRRFSEEAEGAGGWGNPRGTSGEVAGITSSSFFSLLSPSFLLRFSFVSPPFLPFVPPDDDAGDDAMNAVAKRSDSGAW